MSNLISVRMPQPGRELVLEVSTMSNPCLLPVVAMPGGVWFDSDSCILGTVLYEQVKGRHPIHNRQSSRGGAGPDMFDKNGRKLLDFTFKIVYSIKQGKKHQMSIFKLIKTKFTLHSLKILKK
jgi:hypothetical protein